METSIDGERSPLRPKAFGIGFHKTGTSSLGRALSQLGYRVAGPHGQNDPDIANTALRRCYALAEEYNGFQDNPWPIVFREMDQRYAGSKFILTVRETPDWIRSVVEHFGVSDTPMRTWIYGCGHPVGNERIYMERYERHNREVLDYFSDRPGDLLVLRITEGEGWEQLAPFLGYPVPDSTFPKANTADTRRKRARPSARLGRQIARKLRKSAD